MHLHSILMLASTGVVLVFVPVVLVAGWLEGHGRLARSGRTVGFGTWGRRLAAACSAGAAVVHLAVVPEHAAEYPPAGLFFAALATFQLAWAVWVLWRPSGGLALVGLGVNAATIGLWLWSRTLGFPFGAEPGVAERIGYPDLLATLLEVVLVAAAGLLFWERRRAPIARLRVSEADAFVGTSLGLSVIAIFAAVTVFAGPVH